MAFSSPVMNLADRGNGCRFNPNSTAGHYESWFQRANHPTKPLAFWIRYTIFAPRRQSSANRGELWAIFFDGERNDVVAIKEDIAMDQCHFGRASLDVAIGEAILDEHQLRGTARTTDHRMGWDFAYSSPQPPLLLLPPSLYNAPFPKAKALVGAPNARFDGTLDVDGRIVSVDGWQGSQNHNWGSRHTDEYAWGQVAGFDEDADAFLECSTARVRVGPIHTPWVTLAVLRVDGIEHRFNSLWRGARATARYEPFEWAINTKNGAEQLSVHMRADPELAATLRYDNPPGGAKTCLNSKLGACEVTFTDRGREHRLRSRNRAAFEILS